MRISKEATKANIFLAKSEMQSESSDEEKAQETTIAQTLIKRNFCCLVECEQERFLHKMIF